MLNSSFLGYGVPNNFDLHMIDTVIPRVPNPWHPFGVRDGRPICLFPPKEAVANIIHNAFGIRMTKMPMPSIRIMVALRDDETSKGKGRR